MKLGVYSKQDWGYIKLDEDEKYHDDFHTRFTYQEQKAGTFHLANPRYITAEKVFHYAKWAENDGFRFFPKHDPKLFGSLVNPKTGKLYQDFNFEDWAEGETENFAPTKLDNEYEPEVLPGMLEDLMKGW